MNLAKYLKGATTMTELENMPNHYIHTIYKEYVNFLQDETLQKAAAGEDLVNAMGGL
jgi:hypothetical protein